MWIAYARRPLHVNELCHALAVQIGDTYLDEDDIPMPTVIVESCSGLVTIDYVSSNIRLVHYTLQDYILDQKHDPVIHEESLLTNACLTYLQSSFISPTTVEEDVITLLARYPFLAYASEHWGHHADKASSKEIQHLALQFLMDDQKVSFSMQVRDALVPWFDRKSNLLRGITRPQMHQSIGIAYNAKVNTGELHQNRRSLKTLKPPGVSTLSTNYPGQAVRHQSVRWCGLHSAASFGLSHLVTLLLGKGIHLESEDDRGNTALHEAASCSRKDIVQVLLDNGANPNALNYDWATPLSLASWINNPEIIQLLIHHGANINAPCKDEWTALHKAADAGSFESVKLLLQQGASVSCRTARGLTPLHRAAGRGSTEIIRLLIEYGSEVDAVTYDAWTPLHGACSNGQEGVAGLLLECGANIDALSSDKQTPLHKASQLGHNGTVSLLLKHSADRMSRDSCGKIALHRAAKGGHDTTLQLLLQEDRDQLLVISADGMTARDEALYGGCHATAKLLRQMEGS